jgi:hypothetical protein
MCRVTLDVKDSSKRQAEVKIYVAPHVECLFITVKFREIAFNHLRSIILISDSLGPAIDGQIQLVLR